ncbi:trypsin Blo t 3-like [Diprion similis]|uniref:trypsin Blo t 3-like n=1 Tax=Diprion similis TaxID=362088 RepID=UPI001EF8C4A0|nr:trypsin Blo t 3-like [Diprion similis]
MISGLHTVYESGSKSGSGTKCCGPTTIMKLNTLSATLTCALLLLVHGSSRSAVLASSYGTNDSGRRIIDAELANPLDYKFFVKINADGILCGGSILSGFWLVTASHCIYRTKCQTIEIYPSTWSRDQPERLYAAECVTHPQYDPRRHAFDIALIKTVGGMFSRGLEAVNILSPYSRYGPPTSVTTLGWGKVENNACPLALLRGVTRLAPWEACNSQYKAASKRCQGNSNCSIENIPNRILCARSARPLPHSGCGGDSGGPLMIYRELAGINIGAIYAKGPKTYQGCVPVSLTMHTRISDYLPWLFSVIEPHRNTTEFKVGVGPESSDTILVEG